MALSTCKYTEIEINDKKYFKLVDTNYKAIQINTPFMYCPFGLDNNNNIYTIKLEFNLKNPHHKGFFNLLEEIDNKNINFLKCDKDNYIKTVKNNKGHYDITIKLKTFKERIITNVKYNDKTTYLKTIYELEKNCNISCDLEIGFIWNREDKYGLSLTTNNIYVK